MHPLLKIILILSLLTLSQMPPHNAALAQTNTPIVIGIDVAHGNLHVNSTELSNLTSILSANEAKVSYDVGGINQTYLNSISALIISSPQTAFGSTEITSLTSWTASGGRLWLSATYENSASDSIINDLLQTIGSKLRFDYGYASDPLYNLQSATSGSDDVLVPILNHKAGLVTGVTTGVRILYAYRPVPIIMTNGTGYQKFNATLMPDATWIAQTSSISHISNSSSTPLLAYTIGESSGIPVAVTEGTAGYRLVATGFPLFSTWKQTFTYLQNQPYDNRVLAGNLLDWLTTLSISGELEASVPEIRGTTQPLILIYTGSLSTFAKTSEVQPLINLLTDMGFNAQTFPLIGFSAIQNATAIVMVAPTQLITSNETDAINSWLALGHKLLIMASMADYTLVGSATQSLSLDQLLLAINSNLRFEAGSLIDPEVNLGGNPYLTLASNINHNSPALTNLTANVRSLNMQFGTILAGTNQSCISSLGLSVTSQSCFLPLENQTYLNTLTNVTWIAKSSNESRVFDLDLRFPVQAHAENQRGTYILSAIEKYRPDTLKDTFLLLGGPIFVDFGRLLKYPTVYGYPVDNIIFIRNIFRTLLPQTQTRTQISAASFPSQFYEGGNVTLNVNYNAYQTSTSNLSEVDMVPISPANISITLNGNTLNTVVLSNGTYTATGKPTGTGGIPWGVSASAKSYQSQSSSGTVQINPLPTRFTFYVIGIPIVIFIAVTIVVVAKKAR